MIFTDLTDSDQQIIAGAIYKLKHLCTNCKNSSCKYAGEPQPYWPQYRVIACRIFREQS